MSAGNVAKSINHGQDNEAKGQGDANMRNRAAGNVIYNNCTRAGEHERKGSK